jgi:hypothetical protein
MWTDLATVFAIALVAVLIAAGGAWLIVAVAVAVLVLLPASLIGLRRHFEAATRLRQELDGRATTQGK